MTTMTVTGAVTKRCPYKDEVDYGTATITFEIGGKDGPELHALADLLGEYADQAMSHEAFTADLWRRLCARTVETTWTTAGLTVTVTKGGP